MIEVFQQSLFIWLICVFVFSALVGSFLNVVIYRLPEIMKRQWRCECSEFLETKNPHEEKDSETFNLATPNSHCPHCNTPIKPWHNLPIIGYMLIKGKCASCSVSISPRYPIIELITAALSTLIAYQFGVTIDSVLLILFLFILISMTMIDADEKLLPDSLTLPLMWIGILIHTQPQILSSDLLNSVSLLDSIYGAAVAYLSLWTITFLYKVLRGKEGMGAGDFKLFAAFGAWFGLKALIPIILLSSVVGAIVGIIILTVQKQSIEKTTLPFGPYLCGAAFLYIFFATEILAVIFPQI
ncbi:prepilin peptidase [Marinicellulosiphila megalodicopiae]|uniref:prepilin peptidase n=1 Tax=Marinicellulosiphila megalodicopiae TaxID=2724896 RepID=UPI003BAEA8C4